MKFSAELFKTDEYPSYDTKYITEYDGAFYDAYLDENGQYHMAKEDRASLLERVHFYNEYLSKGRYPVYLESSADIYENQKPEDIVAQVLGLPKSLMTKQTKSGGTYMLPVTEIIDRIHFEDGLYRGYGTLEGEISDDFLLGNHYSLIGAINYLIENGIFFQNLERIYDPYRDEPNYYPIYVDEKKIPKKYLEEVETGEKLFFDFFSHPLMITKDNYLSTFATIDSMSFSEKISFAFEELDLREDVMKRELQVSLRNYFFAICRSLINEFYQKEWGRTILYKTVLDTDFEISNTIFSDFYIGPVFTMVKTKVHVVQKENDGYARQSVYSPYMCFEDDKKKMKLAFEGVKRYFNVHPKLCYLPMLFIKLMGLPYPAYEKMKYFDFESGNANQFLKLLYDDPILYQSPVKSGVLLPLYTPGGILLPYERCQSYLPFYHNHYMPDVFYSEPAFFSEKYAEDYLCFHGKTKEVLSFFDGKTEIFDDIFAMNEKEDTDIFYTIHQDKIENGNYKLIHDYFSYMNDGYTAAEASSMLSIDSKMDPHFYAMSMVYLFYARYFDRADKKIYNTALLDTYYKLPATLMLYADENNDTKAFELNRNFVTTFENGERKPFVSDQKEIDAIAKLYDVWSFHMDNRSSSYTEKGTTHYIDLPYEYLTQDFVSHAMHDRWSYSSDVNPLDDKKLYETIKDIPEVQYEVTFRKSLRYGIYIYGEDEKPRALAVLKKNLLPENVSYMISEEFLSILYFGSQFEDNSGFKKTLTKNQFKKYHDKVFTYQYCDVPRLTLVEDPSETYLYAYSGYFQKAWYEYLSGKSDSAFFGYYKSNDNEGRDIYIAPGYTFCAFSYQENLDSFAFSTKDIPLLVKVIKNAVELSLTSKSLYKTAIATCQSGLPYIFFVKLAKMINRKEEINEETLRRYFNFSDAEIDFSKTDVIDNYFFHKKDNLQSEIFANDLKRSLLMDGLYCHPDCQIPFIELADNPEDSQAALHTPLILSNDCRVSIVSEPKGIIRKYLLPDEVLYGTLVSNMIENCAKKRKQNWNLFYVKEFLLFSYYEDHEILLKWIEAMQHHFITVQQFYLFYDEMIDKHSLFQGKDMVNRYVMFYYVFEFLILIEQKIMIAKRKELLEE